MKLVEAQVEVFKNILDSTPVSIEENVTCFVGKNESGKTAFLHALYRLTPAHSNDGFSILDHYPAWLEKRHRKEKKVLEDVRPIRGKFILDAKDVAAIEARFGSGVLKSMELTIQRSYNGTRHFSYSADERKSVLFILKDAKLPTDIRQDADSANSLKDIERVIGSLTKDGGEQSKTALALIEGKKQTLLDNKTDFSAAMIDALDALVPKFFYFDEYSALQGTIRIRELLAKKKDDLSEDERTARALLELAGTEKDYLLNPNYEVRKRELENVANSISQDVLKYWTTNPELRVMIDITQKTVTSSPPNQGQQSVLDELKIRLWDDRHMLSLPFDERSTGFRWFFSFLAAFSQYEASDHPIIILLDEPGLGLHARAQKDFLRFIEERLAARCQVIYSTHSPFLVQPNHLERARLVEDKGREIGSKVTNDVLTIDKDTLFPLQGALGYDLAQHLFVAPHNLVIEGTSDYTYLMVVSDYLKSTKRQGLDDRWSLIPVGGADLIPSFVALLGHHLEVTVLVDSRKEGNQRLNKLAEQGILKKNRIINIGQITKTKLADVEDLFSSDEYLSLYNAAFASAIQDTDLNGSDPIVNRIARFIKQDRFDHGRPADTLLRTRDKFLPTLGAATLERFETLFSTINATLGKD